MFSLSANAGESHVATPQPPPRGQKRLVDLEEEDESTLRAKRAKHIVASSGPELPPAPSTPLFTPPPSINGMPTVSAGRRSSFEPVDVDAVWGLDQTSPPPMHNSQQDASLPLEIGVFYWFSCANYALDQLGSSVAGDSDYAQLFQLFTEVPPSHFGAPKPIEQDLDTQLGLPSFDVPTSDILVQLPAPATTNSQSRVNKELSLDLSGLMSGFMSEEAYNDLGLTFPESTASTSPGLSRPSSSVSLAWKSAPETIPTPAELAAKLQSKERKRKEIEERKAALEKERARVAELERELEDE
ncbi:hypothetical protein JB92DRAFT_2872136 [Gautieria morchelliformis]|nr:hypothetical protein JB92DRAFT_2872136 [Gautieria morchelliformis]